jgi:hypothetical protein
MQEAVRYDGSRLGKAQRTGQGFVKLDSRIARVGVLEYHLANGTVRRELRLPEEVFHRDSLATAMAGLPITIGHPREMVGPSNVKQLKVGQSVQDAAPEGQRYLSAKLQIEDAEAIRRIDSGELQELSCGYSVKIDETKGIWNGQPFDAIQRQVRLNHVALLPSGQGRSGSDVGLRLDAADQTSAYSIPQETMLVKFDSLDPAQPQQHEVSEAVAPLIEQLQAKLKTNETRLQELQAQLEASKTAPKAPDEPAKLDSKDIQQKLGAAEARADQLEKALKDAEKDLGQRIDSRVELIASAKRIMGPEFKHQGLSDRAIREAVLTKQGTRTDGKSDGWVEGAYEAIVSRPGGSIDALGQVVVPETKQDRKDAPPVESLETRRQKALDAAHQAWTTKVKA